MVDQPQPIPNDRLCIQDEVMRDVAERKRRGIETYGIPLQPFNGRNSEIDFYEEQLDAAMYAKQIVFERAHIRKELLEMWTLKRVDDIHERIYRLLKLMGEFPDERS